MKQIDKMTKRELVTEFKASHQQIYDLGCFGVKDLLWYKALEKEILKRGYQIYESVEVK